MILFSPSDCFHLSKFIFRASWVVCEEIVMKNQHLCRNIYWWYRKQPFLRIMGTIILITWVTYLYKAGGLPTVPYFVFKSFQHFKFICASHWHHLLLASSLLFIACKENELWVLVIHCIKQNIAKWTPFLFHSMPFSQIILHYAYQILFLFLSTLIIICRIGFVLLPKLILAMCFYMQYCAVHPIPSLANHQLVHPLSSCTHWLLLGCIMQSHARVSLMWFYIGSEKHTCRHWYISHSRNVT